MKAENRKWGKLFLILLMGLILFSPSSSAAQVKVGVLFVVHGGFDNYADQYLWDTSVQMFSYEPNHSVYQLVIWCPDQWKNVLTTQNGPKEVKKYAFNYERIGGTDPFKSITMQQMSDMIAEMNRYSCNNVTFEYDWAGWISGDDPSHYVYPRFIYNGPQAGEIECMTGSPSKCTYCGEPGSEWPGCDRERYNVDGPIDRLLAKGVSQIILIDLTVGGVRFTKSYDVLTMAKRVLSDNGAGSIPIKWLNDPKNLMVNSKPDDPPGWTPQWSYANGPPIHDPSIPLATNPNPVASDPDLIALNVESIEAAMSPTVPDSQTGVLLLDHALVDWAEYFDPKIDDTLGIIEGIKAKLLSDHPDINPNNIIGAYMGIRENGIAEGYNGLERTRNMRGENLGHAWLYESNKLLPPAPWGYKYWDALEILKNNGVKHIVIGFPQIISDSVLNLVEIPNQIGKEIGIKTWLKWGTFDYITYPSIGHPFADFWGIWVDNACGKGVINYINGTGDFRLNRTVTGQTSKAKGTIIAKTGTTSSGSLTVWKISGIFQNGEIIKDDRTGSAQVNGSPVMTVSPACCFTMGGCDDTMRPYPPPRQTTGARDDMDPSLAYDLSDYGHLGYDPALGAPNPDMPVQNQYTGTWEMYKPASARPEVGEMLAKHILNEFECTSTTTTTAPATVINLQDFQAIPGNRKVTLIWTTASEIDNVGFNIYRSSEKDGSYERINAELIPAKGSPATSSTYQFTDKPVRNRKTYWYKLEDIDTQGKVTMHGPVSAKPGFFAVLSRK
jgi:hypothetical protein